MNGTTRYEKVPYHITKDPSNNNPLDNHLWAYNGR
jgi:hypothetical protein